MAPLEWLESAQLIERPRAILFALGGPALVTALAVLEPQPSTSTAAVLYVLSVAVAAAVGGALAGIAASLASFLALNFFFTAPVHTLAVDKAEDLAALLVFLLVSVITGLLLSAAVRERTRAERREALTRLLNQLTGRLISGHPSGDALQRFAKDLLELLDLGSVEVENKVGPSASARADIGNAAGAAFELPLTSKGDVIAVLRASPKPGAERLVREEAAVLQEVGGQLALALQSVRLTDEVRRVQLEAETNRLRAALFSGVTHDLKTPLSAITASVTSLLDGSRFTDEERREHLDTIRQEAEHLNRVLTNLMDVARLRAGALVPATVPAAIDELIEAVVARLRPLLDGREVVLTLRGELPEMEVDVVQMDQVLSNLIENAVKFSPSGSAVEISAVGGGDHVRVTVADRGPGIAAHDRRRIFEPFERGNVEAAGTGLGLAIAHAVVVAHKGRMWAHDRPAGGAAVTFELPVGRGANR